MTLAAAPKSEPEFDPMLQTAMRTSEELVSLMNAFFVRLDTRRSGDFISIADEINKAKSEIRSLRPQDISETRLPTAGAELLAITRDTENATNVIMTAAETMLGLDASAPDVKDRVDDEVMKIFEACSFQDITGQRVSKIVQVLTQIEQRVSRLAEAIGLDDASPPELTAEEKRQRDLLLNGPAIGGPETQQADIDDLFSADATSSDADKLNSQDDIDALFD
ncbi:protein phosphatase CheZ [Asticcacaulis sp. 201]|uniref:protein phosphatase CheZ n=1 Tax=Asticcacaulis sp. 201 TaxID=3028787 RepID=UPI0029170111|nr:protein phosphatase CheZ [Asticcacaulis sp. 201]MDV6331678.1 protein phosphatase CheZ [Asticcacaulis sp. 201]